MTVEKDPFFVNMVEISSTSKGKRVSDPCDHPLDFNLEEHTLIEEIKRFCKC
jgi:hypothetical protein